MEDHLKWLLDQVETRSEIVRDLARRFRVDFFCGFASVTGQGGFTLNPSTLARLGKLGVPLALDLYPPDPEDFRNSETSTIQ